MSRPLRALIVEDAEDDTLLLVRALSRGGFMPAWRRVDTPQAFTTALDEQPWDVVFADFSMPHFSGTEALRLIRERGLDTPFIIVSGTIGEEVAVEAMRAGANDFLIKGRLARLMPTVERELRDTETRRSRVAMEQELDRKHEQTAQLEREREGARRESEIKSKFLANMSHELRTPLNAIIGFSELLQQEFGGPLTPTQKEYVQDVLQSSLHLLNLINDILDLAKVEAGRVELRLEWMSLAIIVDAVRGVVRALAERRGVRLVFTLPTDLPDVYVDPVRIKQVLYNLLSNAIKATPAGGCVTLTALADAQTLRIAVVDIGIGIAPGDIPRLFQEFEQIEPVRPVAGERPEGTGLGLALTRRLIALHGGTAAVESTPGKGSVFTVILPRFLPERADQSLRWGGDIGANVFKTTTPP